MRVYKQQYTKAIPAGATIFSRKKEKFARYESRGHTVVFPLTADSKKLRCENTHWTIAIETKLYGLKKIKAFTNKEASEKLGKVIQKLVDQADLTADEKRYIEETESRITGLLIDYGVMSTLKPKEDMSLDTLFAGYEKWLKESKHKHGYRRSDKHSQVACSRIQKIFKGCGFEQWADIKGGAVETYLSSLKISSATYNGYVVMFKGFCKWVVRNEFAATSPVADDKLKLLNDEKKTDKRAFTTDEVVRLIDAAENGPDFEGISGHDRAVLYLFAVETGMRRGAIEGLVVADFDFDNCKVNIKTENNMKAAKPHTVYLRPERAEQLKEYFRGKLPPIKDFHVPAITKAFRVPIRTAEMVKYDCERTAPPISFLDDNNRKACFHSLRRTCNTAIQNITKDAILTKLVMGHTIPKQDMTAHYYDTKPDQLREVVMQLPVYQWPIPAAMKATGTDGRNILSTSCFRSAQHEQNKTSLDSDNTGDKSETPNQADSEVAECLLPVLQKDEITPLQGKEAGKSGTGENILLSSYKNEPELQKIVDAWPKLSVELRAAIVKMVR